MATDMLTDLTKAAAQFMAIRAATSIGGGGMSGFLLSSVASKGIDKLFHKPKGEAKPDGAQPAAASDSGPEDVGRRIGEAAASAIEKILKDKLAPISGPSHQQNAGPLLPKPGENQSSQDYINSLNPDQLQILRNGGKPTTAAANNVTQQAAKPAMARVTGSMAAPAAGAGAAAGGGTAAGGTAAAAGPAAAVPPVAVALAAVTVAEAFYNAAKAGRDLAYEQEQHSRRLAEVNAVIGGQQAGLDFNRMIRDMESGDKLAGSNKQLLDAINRFETAMRPLENIFNLLANKFGAANLEVMAMTMEAVLEIGKSQYQAIREIVYYVSLGMKTLPHADDLLNPGGGGEGQGFGDFLKDVADREKEKRRHDEERVRNARGAMRVGGSW